MPFSQPLNLERKSIVVSCSLLTGTAAALVLFGWAAEMDALKSIIAGFPQMKLNSAAAFALAAAGLYLLAVGRCPKLTMVCGTFVGLIGLTTLFQYTFHFELPIDNILVPASAVSAENPHPGRMSPHSALNFSLVGSAVILMVAGLGRIAETLLTVVRIVTVIALLGLLYGAGQLYGVNQQNSMALHTAMLFLLVTTGLGLADPRSRFSEILAGTGAGSGLGRRIIPVVLVVPPAIGFLLQAGYNAGLFDASFRLALTIGFSMIVMSLILVRFAVRVDRVDAERKRAEKILAEKQARYRDLFDHSQGMICIHDIFGNLTSVNPAVIANIGYARDEIEGKNIRAFLPEEHRVGVDAFLRQIENEGLSNGLLPIVAKDGKQLMWQYQSVLVTEDGNDPYIIGHAIDVTELMAFQKQLRALSLKDDLTGLYNRRGFVTLAEQQIKLEMHNGTARGLTLLFADMDGLKAINDTYGHEAGSTAIKTLARLIKSVVRSADVVARWGGDEFVILSIGARNENCQQMIDRIYQSLDEYNSESREPYLIACSIGVTPIYADDHRTFEEMVASADEEMYAEKRRRKVARDGVNILARPKEDRSDLMSRM